MAGFFISFEGPDGAGKSTVIQELMQPLASQTGQQIVVTREPGGSAIAEKIRQIILDVNNQEMDDWTEALLFAASRRQHLVEVIEPALAADKIVLCDRFVDSSVAYQGGGHQLGTDQVAALNDFAIQGHYPDLTLYLDVPVTVGLQRVQKLGAGFDRLEGQKLAFHQRVRDTYQTLLAANPQRMIAVDADRPLALVQQDCLAIIKEHFQARNSD
ncbi:dTMP kinase [Lapidilactobacillus achengensis]|uniref:Thymidylate kinase n=1 Tax=Lapidilactobacillus achengensis TaxID=2486000 RepID=A0ABW1UJF9_9LACO|nr:dTMP kinase [Lapidilactobacillus achengensis]